MSRMKQISYPGTSGELCSGEYVIEKKQYPVTKPRGSSILEFMQFDAYILFVTRRARKEYPNISSCRESRDIILNKIISDDFRGVYNSDKRFFHIHLDDQNNISIFNEYDIVPTEQTNENSGKLSRRSALTFGNIKFVAGRIRSVLSRKEKPKNGNGCDLFLDVNSIRNVDFNELRELFDDYIISQL